MTDNAPQDEQQILLARRMESCARMASVHDDEALMGLADVIAVHTEHVVTIGQARKVWTDLLYSGWDEPAVPIEPVTPSTLHPEVTVETVRTRCCTCGHPINGIGYVVDKRPHATKAGVMTTKIELTIDHACAVAKANCERADAERRERDRIYHEESRKALIDMLVEGGWSQERAEAEIAAVVVAATGVNA